ncbi:hypothetical protein SH528x_004613 [Novipirellula sp. SH528]|uniref:hypothetical protein n=1 Tax=Novipirellula sp. SH528 TaxID=3454466 RepID=UPI003FA047A2
MIRSSFHKRSAKPAISIPKPSSSAIACFGVHKPAEYRPTRAQATLDRFEIRSSYKQHND